MKKTLLMTVLAGAWLGFAAAAGAQHSDVPELKILRHYLGEWESTFTVQGGTPSAEEPKPVTAQVKARWVLGGRFMRQTGNVKLEEGGRTYVLDTLMTWDNDAGAYRRWTFTSAGTASEATGKWDAESRTMTWTGVDEKTGNTTTVSATFKGKKEEHWTIATEKSDGQMVSLIAGTNRRKE